jgi:hypothetical protein
MDNFLDNGTVLPSGLLGSRDAAFMEGFNKTYKNTALRLGIIVRSYGVDDPKNVLNLTTEYDVSVFEQNEDIGSTIITYKNCISQEGMGSIADFFEKNLRVRQNAPQVGALIDTKNQNGALALILCLDGVSDKAIIVGSITHPDRPTTLLTSDPYLQGEYNGLNVIVNNDGSAVLTFKGATDNYGDPIDTTQGNTVVQIETDGSFQLNHSTITFRLDKNGTATLTTNADLDLNVTGDVNAMVTGDANIQCNDLSVTSQGTSTITATGNATIDGKMVNLGAQAAEAVIKGDTFQAYFNTHTHPTVLGPSGPPIVPMPITTLSKKVQTE